MRRIVVSAGLLATALCGWLFLRGDAADAEPREHASASNAPLDAEAERRPGSTNAKQEPDPEITERDGSQASNASDGPLVRQRARLLAVSSQVQSRRDAVASSSPNSPVLATLDQHLDALEEKLEAATPSNPTQPAKRPLDAAK